MIEHEPPLPTAGDTQGKAERHPPANGFSFTHAAEGIPEYQEELDRLENEDFLKQERDLPAFIDTTPLDVFGASRLIGSPAFPLGLVPLILERRAVDLAERLGVDPAMVVMPMLAVCAAAIDDRVQILPLQHDTSWRESARLWIAVIADSGQKKTPALNAAIAPLRHIEKEWMQADKERLRDYHAQHNIELAAEKLQQRTYAKALAEGKEITLPALPVPVRKPPQRRKEVKDTTIEALSEVFVDNAWGMLAVYDELTAWFGSFDAYRKEAIKRDRSLYLESYNGGAQVIDRISRGRVFVPNWSLSLVGGIQPDAMRKLAGQLTDDGLAQRFIVVFTESDGVTYDRREDEEAKVAYQHLVSRLLSWEIGGPDALRLCRFSPACSVIREFLNARIQDLRAMPWVTKAFHTHLSKWEGLFPRLCLTWHCIEHEQDFPFPEVIQEDIAQRVAKFMLEYLLPHASRFYVELMQGKDEEGYARWIAGHILAHDLETISMRDIGRVYRSLRGDIKETQITMEHLTAMGWVTPIETTAPGGPKRWTVNPQVHALYTKRKQKEKRSRADTIQRIQEAVRSFPALSGNEDIDPNVT